MHLEVQAVDPKTSKLDWYSVSDVMRHESSQKRIYQITLVKGSIRVTEDHSLFFQRGEGLEPVEASVLTKGDRIAFVEEDDLTFKEIIEVKEVDSLDYCYDLCVPGPENFVCLNGIVAHNSYSIGGISLDIDKSSKYEGLMNNAEQQFEKSLEHKQQTVKYMRGLVQSRYNMGIRSAVGPLLGRGFIGPRRFI